MADHILRSSPASPFGRKVKIAAAVVGLLDRFEIVVTDTMDAADGIRALNPLGKIPTVVLPDGGVLYDSRVIVEYIDHLAGGGRLIPPAGPSRFAALTLQALGDGIADAALLRRYETMMREPGQRSATWDGHQLGKIERSLAVLEEQPPSDGPAGVGEIAVACALGYLDLRFAGVWRADHPRLVAWLDGFAQRVPAFGQTAVQPT